MHVGGVALFDAAPLMTPDGLTDIDRIRRMIEVGIHRVPRYQQRLARVPLFGNPVWVDDPRFNLQYHVRHVTLPKPGDERLLKRLAGRILSQQLDRGKPLWELWVVDGVEGNRIALITKAHHCMMDGVGSVELTSALIGITRDSVISLATEMGYTVSARRITRDDLYIADEAFFTGTAAEVTPIREVDGRTIGEGRRGPITARIQKAFFECVNGKVENRRNWLTPISA